MDAGPLVLGNTGGLWVIFGVFKYRIKHSKDDKIVFCCADELKNISSLLIQFIF